MAEHRFIPLTDDRRLSEPEMLRRAADFRALMQRRRTVRHFSNREVPEGLILDCLRTASSAPSGANRQPWHFVVVRDPRTKRRIREAAEAEERDFYERRAPNDWLEALAPLGTDADKPFLEVAPYLIVIFAQLHGYDADGGKLKHYYVNESVGIATGLLIAAVHNAGLASLTHTPAPMRFLSELLERPKNERPYLILPVGYPADDARVPAIDKKPLTDVATFL